MNTSNVLLDLKQYKGYYSSKLELKNNILVLLLKKKDDDIASVRIVFNGVLSFEDTGFIGKQVSYCDVGLLGFKNQYLCREKGLNPDDYRQIIFITEVEMGKVELIISCSEVEIILSTDVSG
ncbi:hypothetical protein [Chitinophaga defluvii]|uniref:Uncharacterized protein n=1 Tax=Chitinophaga defluvii TaxID=3163343 RepID=A0ABV2T209_9BACT